MAAALPLRMLAVDATALRNVRAGYRAFMRVQRFSERTYTERSPLRDLVPLLPITVIPDVLLAHLFLHGSLAWLAWLHDIVSLYLMFFLTGYYATTADREHELEGPTLVFHAGLFGRAEVARDTIATARAVDRGEARRLRRDRTIGRLPALANGYVLLELATEARIVDLLGSERRMRRVLIPSDRAADLAERLTGK